MSASDEMTRGRKVKQSFDSTNTILISEDYDSSAAQN